MDKITFPKMADVPTPPLKKKLYDAKEFKKAEALKSAGNISPEFSKLYKKATQISEETGKSFEHIIRELIAEYEKETGKSIMTGQPAKKREPNANAFKYGRSRKYGEKTSHNLVPFNDMDQGQQAKIILRQCEIRAKAVGLSPREVSAKVIYDLRHGYLDLE